jgi:hypothetical protein
MGSAITWERKYQSVKNYVQVAGFIASSEEECQQFFIDRVSAKLTESDGTEELKKHLIEMEATGFDLQGLLQEAETSPRAKDWEIGEAFAEIVLEDNYEAMFPWPTGFDKRTPLSSLPGADLVGLQSHASPRFIFGQVKSSSEKKTPPQIINSTKDCLRNQIIQLRHCSADRELLISWLLVRMRDTDWETAFNEAVQHYADGNFWIVGVLVSGDREINNKDLTSICAGIKHQPDDGEVHLLGFYLPFNKKEWVDLVYGREAAL